jgi:hypothetical protein
MEVEMHCVVDREPQQHPYELEPQRDFERKAIEPVESPSVLRQKHVEIWIEYRLGDQREVLVSHTAFIGSFLADELDFEWALQVALYLAQLLHGVIEDIISTDCDEQEDEAVNAMIEIHIL